MANDIFFRTSLAGYNKQDVMKFIEKLNCEQTERTAELSEQTRMLQSELKKAKEELEKLRNRNDDLDDKLTEEQKRADSNADKASKFDEMQASYADIMLKAETEAQRKIFDAEAEASRIVEGAREEIEQKRKELDRLKSEFGRTFVENKAILEKSKQEFTNIFDTIQKSVESIYNNVCNACNEAENK